MAAERLQAEPPTPPPEPAALMPYPESYMESPPLSDTKKSRKKKKLSGANASSPAMDFDSKHLFSGFADTESQPPKDKRLPLLGEDVIWEREASQDSAKEHTEISEPELESDDSQEYTAGLPITVEQVYEQQTELAADAQLAETETDTADMGTLQPENKPRYRRQPEQQHMANDGSDPRPAGEPAPNLPFSESSAAAPQAGPESEGTPEMYGDVPPALPPDPEWYRYDQPPEPEPNEYERRTTGFALEPALAGAEMPASSIETMSFENESSVGYQRTTADVSRAAWTGLLAGWWLGRRGKNKAVAAAGRQAGRSARAAATAEAAYEALASSVKRERSRAKATPPRLEAEPLSMATNPERRFVESSSEVRRAAPAAAEAAPHVVAASVAALERLRPKPAQVPRAAHEAARKVTGRAITEVAAETSVQQHLPKREVLKIAKDIKIEGVTLKDIYSAKRLDEAGLRTVVAVYLRGGDVRGSLSREITAKEMSFERDPMFRRQQRSAEVLEHASALLAKTGERLGRAADKSLATAKDLAGERGVKIAEAAQQKASQTAKSVAASAKQAQRDFIDGGNTSDWFGVTAVVLVWSAILLIWTL